MRLDSGDTSEWFSVKHGLRQVCMSAPDLSNMFAVVQSVAFDKNDGDPCKEWNDQEGALQGRAAPDDAYIASLFQRSLAKMTAVVGVCAAFGVVVGEKKTVNIYMRSPNIKVNVV